MIKRIPPKRKTIPQRIREMKNVFLIAHLGRKAGMSEKVIYEYARTGREIPAKYIRNIHYILKNEYLPMITELINEIEKKIGEIENDKTNNENK